MCLSEKGNQLMMFLKVWVMTSHATAATQHISQKHPLEDKVTLTRTVVKPKQDVINSIITKRW